MVGATHTGPKGAKDAVAILEWNQRGHHETYLRHYTLAFLRRGHPVIVLCKQPGELTEWITKNAHAHNQRFVAIELPEQVNKQPRNLKHKFASWLNQRKTKQALRKGEAIIKVKCSWIHIACFYEHERRINQRLIQTFNLPWTALYLHPNSFYTKLAKPRVAKKIKATKKLLQDTRLRGLLMLDEHIAPKVRKCCNCTVVHAPDFTNANLPELRAPQEHLSTTNQRIPTIGILGHLLPSKGIIPIAELILQNKLSNHSLILAGEINWEAFEANEQQILKDIQQCPSARTYFERIEDETQYNSLMNECDVLLATYKDFPHSSNTLTKAAAFETPVIVNDGHLMAKRVREYRLGEVVPEGDSNALCDAILKITADTGQWIQTNQPRWEAYRTRHSIESLSDSIQSLSQH